MQYRWWIFRLIVSKETRKGAGWELGFNILNVPLWKGFELSLFKYKIMLDYNKMFLKRKEVKANAQ